MFAVSSPPARALAVVAESVLTFEAVMVSMPHDAGVRRLGVDVVGGEAGFAGLLGLPRIVRAVRSGSRRPSAFGRPFRARRSRGAGSRLVGSVGAFAAFFPCRPFRVPR